MQIINFIGILSITWLFVSGAGSVQFIKELARVGDKSKPKHVHGQIIQALVNCCLCSGFWIGLIYYQNFLYACIVSIAAELFSRVLNLILAKL